MLQKTFVLISLFSIVGCVNSKQQPQPILVELKDVSDNADIIFIGRLKLLSLDDNNDSAVFYLKNATATFEVILVYRGNMPDEVLLRYEARVPSKFWPKDAPGIANAPGSVSWCTNCPTDLFRNGNVAFDDEDMLFLVYATQRQHSFIPVGGKSNSINAIFRIQRDQREVM